MRLLKHSPHCPRQGEPDSLLPVPMLLYLQPDRQLPISPQSRLALTETPELDFQFGMPGVCSVYVLSFPPVLVALLILLIYDITGDGSF
jgi:hypothetical protein